MALAMQSRAAACSRASSRPARCSVVVRAEASQPTRRASMGLLVGAIGAAALFLAPKEASAFKLPSQEFTGGLVTGGGASPKSPTAASAEGYDLEGTKKNGIKPARRAKLLAKARAEGEKLSGQKS